MITIEDIRGHHLCTDLLGKDSVVIDLGACEGEFAQAVNARWGARVFAIEANPETFKKTFSGGRATKHNLGIAARTGTAKLYLADNPEGNSLDARHRDVSIERFVEIPTATLKDFLAMNAIQRVDVVKIDIEGAEVALFHSLDDDTLQQFTQVSVEFHDFIDRLNITAEVAAIKERMKALGFWCIVYRRPNVDVLFLNQRAPGISAWQVRWTQFTTGSVLAGRHLLEAMKHPVKRLIGRRT